MTKATTKVHLVDVIEKKQCQMQTRGLWQLTLATKLSCASLHPLSAQIIIIIISIIYMLIHSGHNAHD